MKYLIVMILALLVTLPVAAQEEIPDPLCDREIDSMVLLQNIEKFQDGDGANVLENAALYLERMLANCDYDSAEPTPVVEDSPENNVETVIFSSEQDGMQAYIGPVDLPNGIYRVTAETEGYLIMDMEADQGNCMLPLSMGTNIFNLTAGDASVAAQSLLAAENCIAYFDVSNTREPWRIEMVTLTSNDITALAEQYYSEDVGRQPVIGPVYMNERYRFTVTTDGFFIMEILELDGDCGSQPLLFNLTAGQASAGASAGFRATDCVGFIGISNTSEPWTLDIEVIE